MDINFFKEFGLIGGLLLATLYSAYKAGNKIYDQMITDKKESLAEQKGIYDKVMLESHDREERLMEHLERTSDTLIDISETLKGMDGRISTLEECVEGSKKEGE